MTDRERWTVYPLLFLVLGIALKDKLFKQVNTDEIFCKKIIITDREGRPQVFAGTTAAGGQMNADELFRKKIVVTDRVLVTDSKGQAQVVLGTTPGGGIARLHGNHHELNVLVGHADNVAGLLYTDDAGNIVAPSLAIQTQAPQGPPAGDAEGGPADEAKPDTEPADGEPAPGVENPESSDAPDHEAPPADDEPPASRPT